MSFAPITRLNLAVLLYVSPVSPNSGIDVIWNLIFLNSSATIDITLFASLACVCGYVHLECFSDSVYGHPFQVSPHLSPRHLVNINCRERCFRSRFGNICQVCVWIFHFDFFFSSRFDNRENLRFQIKGPLIISRHYPNTSLATTVIACINSIPVSYINGLDGIPFVQCHSPSRK